MVQLLMSEAFFHNTNKLKIVLTPVPHVCPGRAPKHLTSAKASSQPHSAVTLVPSSGGTQSLFAALRFHLSIWW